jgi:hypothetical protein
LLRRRSNMLAPASSYALGGVRTGRLNSEVVELDRVIRDQRHDPRRK